MWFVLSAEEKRHLSLLVYDILVYADYAYSGGFSALADYRPAMAFQPLQRGLRSLIAGCNEDETEAIVRGSPVIDEQPDFDRAVVAVTLKGLQAIRSREYPGQVLEDITNLLGGDVLKVVEVD